MVSSGIAAMPLSTAPRPPSRNVYSAWNPAASRMARVASVISGPIPSPGITPILCLLIIFPARRCASPAPVVQFLSSLFQVKAPEGKDSWLNVEK